MLQVDTVSLFEVPGEGEMICTRDLVGGETRVGERETARDRGRA